MYFSSFYLHLRFMAKNPVFLNLHIALSRRKINSASQFLLGKRMSFKHGKILLIRIIIIFLKLQMKWKLIHLPSVFSLIFTHHWSVRIMLLNHFEHWTPGFGLVYYLVSSKWFLVSIHIIYLRAGPSFSSIILINAPASDN